MSNVRVRVVVTLRYDAVVDVPEDEVAKGWDPMLDYARAEGKERFFTEYCETVPFKGSNLGGLISGVQAILLPTEEKV